MSDSETPTPEEPTEGSAEDIYERLVENLSAHAIFELDTDGCIATWPAPANRLYGFDAEAVHGESLRTLFAAEAELDRSLDEVLAAARDETVTIEAWHRHTDDTVFWGTVTLDAIWEDDALIGFTAVCQDTTEQKQYEQMLERQNDRLKEFTDILAHDLRTPLTIIDGNIELFEKTGDPAHIEAVGETTDRMERLVDDLLRVARQGNVVTDPQPTDIGEIVDDTWQGMRSEDAAPTLTSDPIGMVSADGDRLYELFENLFRNAIEHGGPDVTVGVGPIPGGFYIEDDGAGIDESVRDSLFDHGVSTDQDGSGYGLSIVRTIVNAHGWDVVVTDAESGGARFEITGIDPVE